MTHTKHLEQGWRDLEAAVQRKLREANVQTTALAAKRHENNPDSRFPSMESTKEIYHVGRGGALASVLDLIHAAMRELGSPHG